MSDLVLCSESESGRLRPAKFDGIDKNFTFAPRLTARANVCGRPALVNIGGVARVVREGERGVIKSINMSEHPWSGYIGPKSSNVQFYFQVVRKYY